MTDGNSMPPAPDQRPPGWQPPPAPAPGWPAPPTGPPQAPYGPPGQPQQAYPAQPYPPGGYPQPGYGYGVPLHQARPVYKPGTIPLRPLTLSDMYSGAVETIRRNPRATLGVAAVVLSAFLAIPTIGTLLWGTIAGFGSRLSSSGELGGTNPEDIGLGVTVIGGAVLAGLATVVLTGMIVRVVEHAARGQKLSAGEAWRLTRPRIWRLLGLAILSGLVPLLPWIPIVAFIFAAAAISPVAGWIVGIAGFFGGVAVMVLLWVRLFQLAAASLVLEGLGVFAAIGRSWALTRNAFWRTFGISLLTLVVTSVAAQFLTFPFSILGAAGSLIWPDTLAGILVMLLTQNIAQVISGALTTPFSASVAALQYLDQRIRKEGYDIELIAHGPASAPAPPGAR